MKVKIAAKREQTRLQEQLAGQSDQVWTQRREALQLCREFKALNSRTKRVTAAALQLKGQLLEARRTKDAISSLPTTLCCPKCGWSKTVVPQSDILLEGHTWFTVCPECGHSKLDHKKAT